MKKKLNTNFAVGKSQYEIIPTEEDYRYLLNRDGRFFGLLNGTLSTAFVPPQIKFVFSPEKVNPDCSYFELRFCFPQIAIQDAISLLEAHYNSET